MAVSTTQEPKLIILAAGGTGGHVYPALAVAEVIREAHPEVAMKFLGTAHGVEARLVPARGWVFDAVAAKGLRGKSWDKLGWGAASVAWGVMQCFWKFWQWKPSVVVAMSGYASVPAALAAVALNIPLVWHEQNVEPGWSTWLGGRLASRVLTGFPGTALGVSGFHTSMVGNPVRHEALEGNRDAARKKFNISREAKVVLVVGGSQGSKLLNDAVLSQWKGLRDRLPQVHWVWLTGPSHTASVQTGLGGEKFPGTILEYYDAMGELYASADVAVARAGALTLAELAAWGLPAVLVPIERSGGGHQTKNAAWFADQGAAEMVREGDVARLGEVVRGMLVEPMAYAIRCQKMQALGRRSAAAQMARMVMEYVS